MHCGEENKELERAFAQKYLPHLCYDKAEPFSVKGIGYTCFFHTAPSSSCKKEVQVPEDGLVVEYAFFYDFDIQHLYDLEHVFVSVDRKGKIVGVESSFHGKFLNSFIKGVLVVEDETHPVLYVQPGKHAFMPAPFFFELAPERDIACKEKAGEAGFLIMPMFQDKLSTNPQVDKEVASFIKETYGFTPTWQFAKGSPDGEKEENLLLPYLELENRVVERMNLWKSKILERRK